MASRSTRAASEFFKLGRGKLICCSTKAGRNRNELLEMILERLPDVEDDAAVEAPYYEDGDRGPCATLAKVRSSTRLLKRNG